MPSTLSDALFPLTLTAPGLFMAAIVLSLMAAGVAYARPPALPRSALVLFAIGLLCLSLAAGGLSWRNRKAGTVAVVVDLSASTRTAEFRNPQAVDRRLATLLRGTQYELQELSSDRAPRTIFEPPVGADAIVLLSDGRFDAPKSSPPVYAVLDPSLDRPGDAAVERLELRDGNQRVAATVRRPSDGDAARTLQFNGADPARQDVGSGRAVHAATVQTDDSTVGASLSPRDPWPENDVLTLRVPPPRQLERWWIGSGRGVDGWRRLDPANLPADAAAYLSAAVIVLDDIAADSLTPVQHERLEQYVRDLGGGLVIAGGNRAFAAGGYAGTALDRLSPLASTPPAPTTYWVLLADSSGSMAQRLGDNARWNFATVAVAAAIGLLPPDDPISIGNFAQTTRWWHIARPARDVQRDFAIPTDVRVTGPTNLGAALEAVAEGIDGNLPTRVLLITDAEATIGDASALAATLTKAKVRVHALVTGKVPENNPVRRVAEGTGGGVLVQGDPRQWTASLRQMVRQVSPPHLGDAPLAVTFTEAAPPLSALTAMPWNRTWLKPDATELAKGRTTPSASDPSENVPAAAAWNHGSGAVIAASFAATPQVVAALAERVAVLPRDPRFRVAFETSSDGDASAGAGRAVMLTITLDAADGKGFLNGLVPTVEFSDDGSRATAPLNMPQTAPGRYHASLPAPQAPLFATVYVEGRPIERVALAGRYAPEFDAIGNDRAALARLALATGGAVIEPAQASPIDFHWPIRTVRLSTFFSLAGAACIAAALVRWRIG